MVNLSHMAADVASSSAPNWPEQRSATFPDTIGEFPHASRFFFVLQQRVQNMVREQLEADLENDEQHEQQRDPDDPSASRDRMAQPEQHPL
jgi:hypothetical protein